jgi:uncharacterized protein
MLMNLYVALASGAIAGLASAPHCFAMCGPLAVFASGAGDARAARARALRYQLGRLASYAALGAIAGSGGAALASLAPPTWANILLALVLAGAMLFSAWRLYRPAGGVPKLSRVSSSRPKTSLAARAFALLPREPLAIGAMSALLPCGALYAAAMIAVGSGSGSAGAVAMAAFALVSGVGLLAFAWLGAKARMSRRARHILALVLIAGAAVVIARPLLARERCPACHSHAGP